MRYYIRRAYQGTQYATSKIIQEHHFMIALAYLAPILSPLNELKILFESVIAAAYLNLNALKDLLDMFEENNPTEISSQCSSNQCCLFRI